MRISGGIEKHGKRNYRVKVGFDSPDEAQRFIADQNKQAADLLAVPPNVGAAPDVWSAVARYQEVYWQTDTERDRATVPLPDDGPQLVIGSTDWHVGHQWCDMPRLRCDLERAAQTPAVHLVLLGDLFNNVLTTSPRGAQFEELAPPRIQKMIVEQALSWVRGRVLAMCLGNHEARSLNDDDFDPTAYFAHKLGCVNFGSFGLLTVELGEQRYNILAAHRFRMNSSFNKTHTGKRMLDFVADADAVFTGHYHDPAAETTDVRQRSRFIAAGGTYEMRSRYGKSLGFPGGVAEMPGVLLFPGERKMLGFRDAFTDGIHALWSYRRDFDCPCSYCRGPSSN